MWGYGASLLPLTLQLKHRGWLLCGAGEGMRKMAVGFGRKWVEDIQSSSTVIPICAGKVVRD